MLFAYCFFSLFVLVFLPHKKRLTAEHEVKSQRENEANFFRSSSPVPDAKASLGPKLYKKSIELYLLSKWVSS